jgi:hypothetical protein
LRSGCGGPAEKQKSETPQDLAAAAALKARPQRVGWPRLFETHVN